jgi:hypothetical protein
MAAIDPAPTGTRLLHELAALADNSYRVAKPQRPGRNVGGILAKAVSGDEGRLDSARPQHPLGRDAHGQNRGLGVFGEYQL